MDFPTCLAATTQKSWIPLSGLQAHTFDGQNSDLRTHWASCLAKSARSSQFSTHSWYSAWLATYGSKSPWTGQGHVVVLTTTTGETVGLLPLAAARNRGLRFLALAGYFQPVRSFLVDAGVAESAGATLASALLESPLAWDLLRIGPIDLTIPGHRGFLEWLREHSALVDIRTVPKLVVCRDLPADFGEYQAKVMGRGFVKEVQHKERLIKRDGGFIRHYHNPSGEELDGVLRDCRLVEGHSWLATAEDARFRFATELDLEFWRQFVSHGLPQDGGLDVWILYFAAQPVSYCLAITAGGIRYTISNQYDQKFYKYSTGSVIFFHLMKDACNSGLQAVNFGDGDSQYKGRWGGVEEGECVEALFFPRGLKGRCLAVMYKQLRRLRPSLVNPS